MPIFEYECKQCNNQFEELVSNPESEPESCPSCGSSTIQKKMSAIGGIGRSSGQLTSCGAACPSASACANATQCCRHS